MSDHAIREGATRAIHAAVQAWLRLQPGFPEPRRGHSSQAIGSGSAGARVVRRVRIYAPSVTASATALGLEV